MQKPPLPSNETQRLQALHHLAMLDSTADERFERLTRLARRLFNVPFALISLVDTDRVWFKSRQGLIVRETERDLFFCAHAILQPDVFVVSDANNDVRFAEHPLVADSPHIRFYAGAPLHESSGQRIGTLCILDVKPRHFSESDKVSLKELADTAESLMRADTPLQQSGFGLASQSAFAQQLIDSMQDGFSVISPDGIQQQVNPAFCNMTEFSAADLVGQTPPYPYWPKEQHEAIQHAFAKTLTDGKGSFELIFKKKSGERFPVQLSVSVLKDEQGHVVCYFATVKDISAMIESRQALSASRDQFASLVNNIPGITYRCLLDEQWTMIFMSDQVDPLSGYPAQDFIQNAVRSYDSVIHHEDRGAVSQVVTDALQTGQDEWRVEYRILHRDGSIRWAFERGTAQRDETGTVRFLDGFILDITDRKQADEALHQQKWLYETILEHSLAGYWDWNIPQRKEYLSPSFKKMFGYHDSEMENSPDAWQKIIFQEDLPEVLANFDAHVSSRGGIPFDNEVRYYHKDGSTVWVRCLGEVVEWDANGDPVRMIGCHLDITDYKENQQMLARLSQVASQTSNGVIISDREGYVEWVNDGFTRITGYTLAEMKGRKPGEVLQGPDTEPEKVLQIRSALAKEEAFEVQLVNYTKDNKPYCIHIQCSPLKDNTGATTGFIAIESDVTEEAALKHELQQQKEFLESILESNVTAITVLSDEGKLIKVNRGAAAILGIEEEKLEDGSIGYSDPLWHITDLQGLPIPPEHLPFSQLKAGKESVIDFRHNIVWPNGTFRTLSINGAELPNAGGAGTRYVFSIRDITEQLRVEKLKSQFVSTVSHELRTPLTSIKGVLGILFAGKLGPLSEKAQEMIAIAYESSERLGRLINDLLDIEKLAAGKMSLEIHEQSLFPLLEQAVRDNKAYATRYDVTIVLNAIDHDHRVAVDADRLQQVLANLLSNAVKFSPKTAEVVVTCRVYGGSVRVSVQDHGPGIPAAFHDRIFQRFAQADASDTRQKGGTGLGLAISRELIEQMNGQIGFESIEGAGATFWFELPLANTL